MRTSSPSDPGRILIVTNSFDLHADIVAAKLSRRGHRPFRLDMDAFPAVFDLSLQLDDDGWRGMIRHLPTGDELAFADVGAVWMRKRGDFRFRAGELAPQERAYAIGEMDHLLFGLLYAIDGYWMSHPRAMRAANWKVEQLQRARRMGMAVPPSLLTSRRDDVDGFRRTAGRDIIFKPLSSGSLGAEVVGADDVVVEALPTTRVTEDHEDLLDAVGELPCFFQRHVAKRYEIRATVIGDQVFAARINSQDDPRTVVDYRDFSAEIRYEVEVLPPEVARFCIDFVHSYGLNYGAIDLIVTPDGEHVFLENNPVGQFLFVEELVPALAMSDALADCLIRGLQVRA